MGLRGPEEGAPSAFQRPRATHYQSDRLFAEGQPFLRVHQRRIPRQIDRRGKPGPRASIKRPRVVVTAPCQSRGRYRDFQAISPGIRKSGTCEEGGWERSGDVRPSRVDPPRSSCDRTMPEEKVMHLARARRPAHSSLTPSSPRSSAPARPAGSGPEGPCRPSAPPRPSPPGPGSPTG